MAEAHAVGHALAVLPTTLEAALDATARGNTSKESGGGDSIADTDVLVLTPLLEEAVLGQRLLAAAAAAARLFSSRRGEGRMPGRPARRRPTLVPSTVTVWAALGDLSAGSVNGVDLSAVDVARWSPYPLPMAVEVEEGGALLCGFERVFAFDLSAPPAIGQLHSSDVSFVPTRARTLPSRGQGGYTCNALVLDVVPGWEYFEMEDEAAGEAGEAGSRAREPPGVDAGHGVGCVRGGGDVCETPQKRAVLFLEPFRVEPKVAVTVRFSHDALRLWACPPAGHCAAPHPHWGRILIHAWHFCMLHDCVRNDAYHTAIDRAVAALRARQQHERGGGPIGSAAPEAIDVGCGSGLLSVMLAQAMGRHRCAGKVLGVEVLLGMREIAERVVVANGEAERIRIICKDMATVCDSCAAGLRGASAQQRASYVAPPLLVAELMDTSGHGEGLLALTQQCVTSGMVGAAMGSPSAHPASILPARLRLWALLAELRQCGTSVDGAELLPSSLRGVSLAPWLRYQKPQSFAGLELACADYMPLSEEFLLHEGEAGKDVLGAEPRPLAVRATATGRLNAIIWSWEVELDGPAHTLSSHAAAPKTHWRQAVHLFPTPRDLAEGDHAVVLLSASGNGRAISVQLVPPTATPPAGTVIPPPTATRHHVRRHLAQPRRESPLSPDALPSAVGPDGRRVHFDSPARDASSSRRASGASIARSVTRTGFTSRLPRVPVPPAPSRPDDAWTAAKDRLFALNDGPLRPSSLDANVALCEAALLIGAHPAQYGVHPVDAEQAVRLFYSA